MIHVIIIWKIRGKTSKFQKLKSNPHAIRLKIRFSNYRVGFGMLMVNIRTTTCNGGIGGHGCKGKMWNTWFPFWKCAKQALTQ